MEYTAEYFGRLFVTTAQREDARRSYKGGISRGTGHIPYDTGRTQRSVRLASSGKRKCTVKIGGVQAPYDYFLEYSYTVAGTSVINRHRGFVERFARTDFVRALEREFGKVEIK